MRHLNMLCETEKEIDSRKGFRLSASNITRFAYVGIVVKGNDLAVIGVDAGSTDTRTAEIASDIFYEFFQIMVALEVFRCGLSTDNETVCIFRPQGRFNGFEIRNTAPKLFKKQILIGEG